MEKKNIFSPRDYWSNYPMLNTVMMSKHQFIHAFVCSSQLATFRKNCELN